MNFKIVSADDKRKVGQEVNKLLADGYRVQSATAIPGFILENDNGYKEFFYPEFVVFLVKPDHRLHCDVCDQPADRLTLVTTAGIEAAACDACRGIEDPE